MKENHKDTKNQKAIETEVLDQIIKDTIQTVEDGEQQIYEIAENARMEYYRTKKEAEKIKEEVKEIIKQVDSLESDEKKARLYLMEVSSNFDKYSEKDIFEAYEKAKNVQVDLSLMREREFNLRKKRDELELTQKRLSETVTKAENLVTQVGVVLKYLSSNLSDISTQLEEIHQRQMLALKIIKAQEEERKRIAREIHDGPAQSMANIVLRAELCEKLQSINPEKIPTELANLREVVREVLQDLRKIIFDLRPMALDDLGIVPTLKRFITDYEEKYGVSVELIVLGEDKKLSSSINLAIFRTIQEALTNIKKHASAKKATVKVEFLSSKINLAVKDDGCGFNPDEVMNNNGRECFGLIGLQERIELLEGEVEIISSPEKGTLIKAALPIS